MLSHHFFAVLSVRNTVLSVIPLHTTLLSEVPCEIGGCASRPTFAALSLFLATVSCEVLTVSWRVGEFYTGEM
jgi:hypothetical protein